jgi:hypothetical protein
MLCLNIGPVPAELHAHRSTDRSNHDTLASSGVAEVGGAQNYIYSSLLTPAVQPTAAKTTAAKKEADAEMRLPIPAQPRRQTQHLCALYLTRLGDM